MNEYDDEAEFESDNEEDVLYHQYSKKNLNLRWLFMVVFSL